MKLILILSFLTTLTHAKIGLPKPLILNDSQIVSVYCGNLFLKTNGATTKTFSITKETCKPQKGYLESDTQWNVITKMKLSTPFILLETRNMDIIQLNLNSNKFKYTRGFVRENRNFIGYIDRKLNQEFEAKLMKNSLDLSHHSGHS